MNNGPTSVNAGPQSSQQIENQQAVICSDFSPASITKNQPSPRSTKRRHKSNGKVAVRSAPSSSRRRELAIYDGQNLVGIVKVAVDGRCTTLDARGKRVGVFPSQEDASDALDGGGK
jgi:hypothetical protein